MRVRDWDQLYENNRSRELNRTAWFPAPNDLAADWYAEIVSDQDGAAHLGVWYALLMVASKAKPRGSLVRSDGQPHRLESLARVTRLSEPLLKAALARLLKIGLLEISETKRRRQSKLGSHPPATESHGNAVQPQAGAVERKGKEHHHQGKKRKGKEQQQTEPERARQESATERSDAHSGFCLDFPKKGDDEGENPVGPYASAEDELKAIYQAKTGEGITINLLDVIRVNLECTSISMNDYVAEVRKHAQNEWRNPAGFLRNLSHQFCAKTCIAPGPVTAAEAAARNYKCQVCGSTNPGEGVLLVDGKFVACSCAGPEYIARQRNRGVFAEETPQ